MASGAAARDSPERRGGQQGEAGVASTVEVRLSRLPGRLESHRAQDLHQLGSRTSPEDATTPSIRDAAGWCSGPPQEMRRCWRWWPTASVTEETRTSGQERAPREGAAVRTRFTAGAGETPASAADRRAASNASAVAVSTDTEGGMSENNARNLKNAITQQPGREQTRRKKRHTARRARSAGAHATGKNSGSVTVLPGRGA